MVTGKFSQNGKFGQNGMSGQKSKVHLGPKVSSSSHDRGAWSMAVVLWQQYEYYYYSFYFIILVMHVRMKCDLMKVTEPIRPVHIILFIYCSLKFNKKFQIHIYYIFISSYI